MTFSRNGIIDFSLTIPPNSYFHFGDIYAPAPTTMDDIGFYRYAFDAPRGFQPFTNYNFYVFKQGIYQFNSVIKLAH